MRRLPLLSLATVGMLLFTAPVPGEDDPPEDPKPAKSHPAGRHFKWSGVRVRPISHETAPAARSAPAAKPLADLGPVTAPAPLPTGPGTPGNVPFPVPPATPSTPPVPSLHQMDAPAPQPVIPPCPVPMESAPGAEPGWRVFALGGITLFHATPASNQAFLIVTNDSSGPALPSQNTTTTQRQTFQNDLAVSPLCWLGVVNSEGFGLRGRYWYFYQADSQTVVNDDTTGNFLAVQSILPAPFTIVSSAAVFGILTPGTGAGALAAGVAPDVFAARQSLTLHVGDVEISQTLASDLLSFTAGAGVRFAHIGQAYDVVRNNAGGTGLGTMFLVDRETSQAQHDFGGFGPTLSAEVTRSLGATGVTLYGQGRGALLVGRHRLSMTTTRRAVTDGLGGLIDNTVQLDDRAATTEVLPVGELEVGVEYMCRLGNVRGIMRAGFQVQTWWDAGSLLSTTGDLDFYGGSFLLGVLY